MVAICAPSSIGQCKLPGVLFLMAFIKFNQCKFTPLSSLLCSAIATLFFACLSSITSQPLLSNIRVPLFPMKAIP